MHQSIEERMFVSQQRLWGVKLDHSPTIHDKNTVTIHNGIEPKTREIALIINFVGSLHKGFFEQWISTTGSDWGNLYY